MSEARAEQSLDFQDLALLARRHIKRVILFAILGTAIGFGLFYAVPKKFKTLTILNIQNSYFQSPILQDLGSGVNDLGERETQKQALIQLAINDEYVETLGDKFKVFKSEPGSSKRSVERDSFKKVIEALPLNSSTFQIAVTARSAERSFAMTQDVLSQIMSTLVRERSKQLMRYRDSLTKEIEALKSGRVTMTRAPSPSSAESIQEDLSALEKQIAAMRTRVTPEHPALLDLEESARIMRDRLQNSVRGTDQAPVARPGARLEGQTKADIQADLQRKLKNLDIALELERNKEDLQYLTVIKKPVLPAEPIFPKLRNFTAGGALAGILISLFFIVLLELKRTGEMTPILASEILALPLLGTLPPFEGQIYAEAGDTDVPNPPVGKR